jgi:putative flippase GtrA
VNEPHPIASQFFRYLAVGVGTTGLYYGLWAALFAGGVDYRVASGVGYGIGSIVAFILQKRYIFADRTAGVAAGAQLAVYWTLVGASLALTVGLVWTGVSGIGLAEWLSVGLASGVTVVFNFAAHKWITFNPALWSGRGGSP